MSTVPEVDAETARDMIAAGAYLLDVREPDEWDAGHVPDAVHVPLGEVQPRVAEVPTDRALVVICRSGARSLKAAEWLATTGRDAINLAGGSKAWVAAGLPFVATSGSPGVVA